MPEARRGGHVAIIVLLEFGGKLDMHAIRVSDTQEKIVTGAGIWPYVTLLAGALVVYVSHRLAIY